MKLGARGARLVFPTSGLGVGAGAFSVEACVRPLGEFVTGRPGYVFMGGDATHEGLPTLFLTEGRPTCAFVGRGGSPNNTASSSAPLSAAWHHLACVRTAGRLVLWVDGSAVASGPSVTEVVAVDAQGTVGGGLASPIPYEAASALVGPVRYSRVARYATTFAPRAFWRVDEHTVLQFLSTQPFDGERLVDEAGRDHDATHEGGAAASSTDVPCEPVP